MHKFNFTRLYIFAKGVIGMDLTIKRISEELKLQNKKQSDLAEYIGVTANVITDWKSGRIKSYSKYIHGIAQFLGVSVEYLKGETDSKLPMNNADGTSVQVTDNLIKFALFGGDAETISNEALEDVKRFAQIVAEKERRKKENGSGTP